MSIGTKFSLAGGALAFVFSAIILYQAWRSTDRYAEELTSAQARLALEFDLAIREYVKDAIRPSMEKRLGKDEFVVEAMSTSFVAREVFDKATKAFPDYAIKFSSENPRNPKNLATAEERSILQHFRDHPDQTEWTGRMEIGGKEYYARFAPMRIEAGCLTCHGLPEDSPKELLERYGTSGGFYHKVGDLAGMDMVAVPIAAAGDSLFVYARNELVTTGVCLAILCVAIFVAFRVIVGRRLGAITRHLKAAAGHGDWALDPIAESGNDEIAVLAHSFNSLAGKLRSLHGSLERQVAERTRELTAANDDLRAQVESRQQAELALRQEQRLLKQSLRTHDSERQTIAYEIHDGLAQQLTAAIMAFQAAERLADARPDQAAAQRRAGANLLAETLAEARRLINGVRPPLLDENGLVVAVGNFLSECQAHSSVEIEFHHSARFLRLEPVVENAVYRIVQESVNNARVHSGSNRIRVGLTHDDLRVRVEVQDWGRGFDVSRVKGRAMGLRGVKHRAKSLGGKATVESQLGAGTKIVVELPLGPPEGDLEDSQF